MPTSLNFALNQKALADADPSLRFCGNCSTARPVSAFTHKRSGEPTKLCAPCREYLAGRKRTEARIASALRKHYPAVYADLLALASKDAS